jgi:hypothetical protein
VLAFAGTHRLGVLIRNGGTYWVEVSPSSKRLSASMRLALAKDPVAKAGSMVWRLLEPGFEVADLPALVDGREVDRIYLARIDPAYFRFVVQNAPSGDKDVDQWMRHLGAVLVVNGSYYSHFGRPVTPVVSEGALLGPRLYDAKAGAFVARAGSAAIRDLSSLDWKTAFGGADNAIVSNPLLLDRHETMAVRATHWLANRSFVGEDNSGKILIGTTKDAFFSLSRLAALIHGMAGIRWRMSHKRLILLKDWVLRPLHSPDHAEPHPPCPRLHLRRSVFQPSGGRNSQRLSMAAA